MKELYNPSEIEPRIQAFWEENRCFEAKEDLNREKFYCLSMLPYPSGDLHMGHARNYTIGDVISRYQRMLGKNVLQPMGWDAFGLPAENAALARRLPPAEWTRQNIKKMRAILKKMGYGFDWSREIATCDSSYYRWEQWLFLQLYKKGLVYKKNAVVNWDPVDQTVLANEQVVDGKGWRSGATIERRELPQWFFKITAYAEELLNDLQQLTGWPDAVVTMQRNWIGRSAGVNINFKTADDEIFDIYTTRPDTLMGVTYIAIAPEHPLAQACAKNPKIAALLKKWQQVKVAEADMATIEKEGIDSGLFATHPITQEKLPIWITNYVLFEYGCGAVMAVPAHDQRDFEFAKKYNLPIKIVIEPDNGWDFSKEAYTEDGHLIHSGKHFDGLPNQQAKEIITDYLVQYKLGERRIHFRLRDWGISRQRYWGTPIPMIICKKCGDVPVPENNLPVVLPENLIPDGHGSPLASSGEFYEVKCPSCDEPARRETDTMDTFVESSWYYARYCCPEQTEVMLDDRAKYWTPVNQYIGGIEHAILHLLYARFIHKVLRDLNLLSSDEPFSRLLTQGMVLKDGAKMSKSKGNIVALETLAAQFGADTARLFTMFASPPEQSLEWSDSGVEGCHRFLNRLWRFAYDIHQDIKNINTKEIDLDTELQEARKNIHLLLQQADQDMQRQQFNTVVSACMKLLNLLQKIPQSSAAAKHILKEGLHMLLCLLAPITPHISQQLWKDCGFGENILQASWPKVDIKALETERVEMIVQVNGKLRGKIVVSPKISESDLQSAALRDEGIQKFLDNRPIKKIIVVPNRLVNIVI